MAAEKTRAIVIRAVPFGETSSVVSLYCREFGKVRALAKGAWRPKSGFDGSLDLLSVCQVLVLRKTSGGLDLLTEACLENRFRVRDSYLAFLGGMHVAELLDVLTADSDPQPEMFDAAQATLRELCSSHADDHVHALLLHAELAMLRAAGHAPALRACAECRVPLESARRVAFGMLDGGALCGRCRSGKRAVASVSCEALGALRTLAAPGDAWRGSVPKPAAAGEARAVMSTLLAHVAGRPLAVAPRLQPGHAARRIGSR